MSARLAGGVLLGALLLAPGAWAAAKKAQLKLEVKPAGVSVSVDDKPVGQSGKDLQVSVAPGRHTIKLTRRGVSHEETVNVKSGESKTWAFDLGGGTKDEVKLDDSAAEPTEEKGAEETN
jgi:hypothetical protein